MSRAFKMDATRHNSNSDRKVSFVSITNTTANPGTILAKMLASMVKTHPSTKHTLDGFSPVKEKENLRGYLLDIE